MKPIYRHLIAIVLAGVIFIILIVSLFFLSDSIMGKIIASKESVFVPEFTGNDFEKAQELARLLSLNLAVSNHEHSELPAGKIISQHPPVGRKIYKFRTVNVVVSSGQKMVTIPILTGQSFSRIDEILRIYELRLGDSPKRYSDEIASGFIIETIPRFGTSVMAGTPISVVVSIGRDPLNIPPPDPEVLEEYGIF
jgi:serine/threonine-protein kinase